MGELVEIRLGTLELGAWWFDQAAQRWNCELDKVRDLSELTWI